MRNTGRVLVVMGSGETSPTMVTVHREVTAALGPRPRAVLLDTPYAFQENAAEVTGKALGYFRRSVGLDVECVTGLAGAPAHAAGASADAALSRLRTADWVFCGPGSPTYALGYWRGTPAGAALDDLAGSGRAAVVFASAAACALGRFAVPVYEIYKVGAAPSWLPGLDLVRHLGLDVAVVPHYDNTEGGTHDTRYAYLGERRLRILERDLPGDIAVLGVDEHTALVVDPAAGSVEVRGRGGVTVRRRGESVVLPAGTRTTLSELRSLTRGEAGAPPVPAAVPIAIQAGGESLQDTVTACQRRFEAASGDVGVMVAAVLEVEAAVTEWGSDTEEDEGGTGWARAVLRSMIVRLGEVAARPPDPARALGGGLDRLVDVRDELRRRGDWPLADAVRDALSGAGIDLRDAPGGSRWSVR